MRRWMVARVKVAILDDYQNVALQMADWSAVAERADITVFNDHVSDPDRLVARLAPFDIVFVMRERTPLPLQFFGALAGFVVFYLILVEFTKKWFYAEQTRLAEKPQRTRGREHRIHRRAARFSHAGDIAART